MNVLDDPSTFGVYAFCHEQLQSFFGFLVGKVGHESFVEIEQNLLMNLILQICDSRVYHEVHQV